MMNLEEALKTLLKYGLETDVNSICERQMNEKTV